MDPSPGHIRCRSTSSFNRGDVPLRVCVFFCIFECLGSGGDLIFLQFLGFRVFCTLHFGQIFHIAFMFLSSEFISRNIALQLHGNKFLEFTS